MPRYLGTTPWIRLHVYASHPFCDTSHRFVTQNQRQTVDLSVVFRLRQIYKRSLTLCKKDCYTPRYNIIIHAVIRYVLYTLCITVYNGSIWHGLTHLLYTLRIAVYNCVYHAYVIPCVFLYSYRK